MSTRRHLEKDSHEEIIGLIPAAGRGTRLGVLPCSKELLPISFSDAKEEERVHAKPICYHLLEKMRHAGIRRAFVLLGEGKWDIPAYLRKGELLDMHLAYLVVGATAGVPYTLDQAYPFVKDKVVALGFPDVLFSAKDGFVQLLSRQALNRADVILGVFPADRPRKVDMVEIDGKRRVRRIVIKPRATHLTYTWTISVWTPVFSDFMHRYLQSRKGSTPAQRELFIGDVMQAAIEDGLRVEAVHVSRDPYIDIGTPEDLLRAINATTAHQRAGRLR